MTLVSAVGLAGISVSCGIQLGEEPQDQLSVELGSTESGCLTGMSDRLLEIWKGEASEARITSLWDCASRSFQLFMDRTRGAQPGVYTPDELRNFLERYFIKDFHVPDSLLTEVMELKKAILGGQADIITRDELQRSRQLISIFKKHSLLLRPYMPLSPKHYEEVREEILDGATIAMEEFSQEVGAAIEETRNPYLFARFDQLLTEISAVATTEGVRDFVQTLKRRMTMIRALKSTLIAPDPERIIGREWAKVLTTGAKWHGCILKYAYLKSRCTSWQSGRGRLRFVNLAYDILGLLDESISRHPDELITFAEMDQVLESLSPDDLHEIKLTLPTMKQSLRPLIRRALSGRDFGINGRHARGLNRLHVRRAAEIVQHWSEGQRYLENSFQNLEPDHGLTHMGFVPEDFQSLSLERVLGEPAAFLSELTRDAVSRLQRVLNTQRPLFVGTDSEITLNSGEMTRRYSFKSISKMNLIYEIVRVLMEGYIDEPNRDAIRSGVNSAELRRLYCDTKAVGVELKYFDPINERVVDSRFRDANMFNFASNGDQWMDTDEAVQQFSYMVSAKLLANQVHDDLKRVCRNGPLDFFEFPILEPGCYRREFFSRFETYWARFPALASYYRGLSPERRREFNYWFEKASRRRGYTQDDFDSTDSEAMAMMAHYLESIYVRYDTNHSGGIDDVEARAIFPVVRAMIAQFSHGRVTGDDAYMAILTYLLKYGEQPGAGDYVLWRTHLNPWNFESDRMQILKIFANISSQATATQDEIVCPR